MAEYNFACLSVLKKKIGVPDALRTVITNNSELRAQAEQGFLDTSKVNFSLDVLVVKQLADYYSLTDVNFMKNENVTDSVLKALAEGGHALRRLNLRWCNEPSDTGLLFLSQRCQNLEYLNLCQFTDNKKRTDEGLKYIANGCHKLQVQKFSNKSCKGFYTIFCFILDF